MTLQTGSGQQLVCDWQCRRCGRWRGFDARRTSR